MLSRYVAQVLYEWLWDGSSFPVIIGATFVFIFLVRCIFIVWFILFKIVAASFLNTVLSAETAMLVNILLIIILLPHLSPWRQCYVRTDSACVKFGGFHLKIYIPATSAFVDLQTIRHALTNFLLPNTHTHTFGTAFLFWHPTQLMHSYCDIFPGTFILEISVFLQSFFGVKQCFSCPRHEGVYGE